MSSRCVMVECPKCEEKYGEIDYCGAVYKIKRIVESDKSDKMKLSLIKRAINEVR